MERRFGILLGSAGLRILSELNVLLKIAYAVVFVARIFYVNAVFVKFKVPPSFCHKF